MKLKKPKEETPKYEGKFWSYPRRKFVGYEQWIREADDNGYKKKSTVNEAGNYTKPYRNA